MATRAGRRVDGRPHPSRWTVAILGPTLVSPDGPAAEPSLTLPQRRVLALLALTPRREASTDTLIDALWNGTAPATARNSLQNQVSRIRTLTAPELILTTAAGYRLGDAVAIDVEQLVAHSEEASHALAEGDGPRALVEASAAVALVRGQPLLDLVDSTDLAPMRTWLEGLVDSARSLEVEAALRAGHASVAISRAEALVLERPLDEHRWVLLARALDLAGRRGDALAAIDRARRTLRQELGIAPGTLLRRLEQELLADDPGGLVVVADTRRPLRGRDRELTEITERVARRVGTLLVGEPGSGRSHVLDTLGVWLRRAGLSVTTAACAANPATAIEPLDDLLEGLGAERDLRLGPVDGFVAALTLAAGRRPAVMIVDDLHLAGPTTVTALRAAMAVPNVIVVASIEQGAADHDVGLEPLRLAPLEGDAIVEMVRDLRGSEDVEPHVLAPLIARSGGNPFLLRCLLDEGDAPGDGRASTLIARLVRRRLVRLGPDVTRAAEVVAVAGSSCRLPILHRLASEAGLQAALDAGLLGLDERGEVVFRQGACAEVVYGDLPPGRRAEFHHAIAALEHDAGRPAAVVAHHLMAAVELDAGTAWTTTMQAGAEAAAAGLHREASEWYGRAASAARVQGTQGAEDLLRADIAYGNELRLSGDPGHVAFQLEVLERALTAGDPVLIGDAAYALLQLGGTSDAGAANLEAVAAAERALTVLEGDERWAVVAAATSLTCSLTGLAERSRSLFVEAERRALSPEVRRLVLPFTYLGLGHADDLERRAALAGELMSLALAADDPVAESEAHQLAFSVALQRADGPGVRDALAGMERLVDRAGDVGRRWQLLYCAAAVAHLDDDLGRAEQLAGASHGVFSGVSAGRAFAAYGSQLILLRLADGRVVELAPAFEGLVASQPQVGAWHGLLALCIAGTEPARAAEHARIGLGAVPRDFTWLASHTLGARAAAHAAMGGATDAPLREYRELLEPYADRIAWQGTCAYGPVATALAELAAAEGDGAARAEHVATARKLAERLGAPVFARELAALA